MRVSIIVPVYNAKDFLPKCLDSILSQTYSDFELILIDDGSTDGSGDICDRYALNDCRIRVAHQPNAGVSAARNTGLDLAIGDYVFFNDADDYIENGYVQAFMGVIDATNADWVLGGPLNTQDVIRLGRNDFGLLFTKYRMSYRKGPCAKVFSNAVIRNNKLRFDEGVSIGEDYIFNLKYLLAINTVSIANIPFYIIVSRPGSLSRSHGDPSKGFLAMRSFLKTANAVVIQLGLKEKESVILYRDSLMYIEKLLGDINQLSSRKERMNLYKMIDLSLYDKYKVGNTWKEKILVFILKQRFFYCYDMLSHLNKEYI